MESKSNYIEKLNIIRAEREDNNDKEVSFEIKPYDWHDEEILKVIKCSQKYVTEGIGEGYLNWIPENPILISAQTGSGKNEFVKKKLIPAAIESKSEILILVNRTAVSRQQKRIVAEAIGEKLPSDYTDRELDAREIFGCVTIKTYQKLGAEIDEIYKSNYEKGYKYVVLDECHFFKSDSLFNNVTYRLLEAIRINFRDSIRIYMTATPDEIFGSIMKIEKNLPNLELANRIANPLASWLRPFQIYCYEFDRDFKYVNPYYFNAKKELIDKINQDESGEKWLVFVSSKKNGQEIAAELGSKAVYIDASAKDLKGENEAISTINAINAIENINEYFDTVLKKDNNLEIKEYLEPIKSHIDAFSKTIKRYDMITYAELIKNQKFEKTVLVTTSVLDNGINLKDDLLKNIVIMTSDKTSFLQMLGRIRLNDGKKINMYIQNRKSNHFEGKINITNQQLTAYLSSLGNKKPEFIVKFLEGKIELYPQICNLYSVNYDNLIKDYKISWNKLAIDKLKEDEKFLLRIKEKIKADKDAFIKEQLSWIGFDYNKEQYISDELQKKYIKEFEDFLYEMSIAGKELNKEEKEEFEKEFREKYFKAYGERDSDNSIREKYGKKIMSDIFKELNLPYEIKNLSTGKWKFVKVQEKG
nr:DEAD/DEAH box helicase family protein [Sedimentibacter sp.]